ncbi:hypothetical protein [Sphingomonas sp. Leaf198]|uniref:hypothetical protein n=1 Tax=Sphingomonas sp. Leaf198 TaxID=1736299 RepID=UPI0012E25729|nr:hypothetical protein [Sphingomonas sp. Leaf198]
MRLPATTFICNTFSVTAAGAFCVPHVLIPRSGRVPMLDASGVAVIAEILRRAATTHTRVILRGVAAQPAAIRHPRARWVQA